MKFYRARIVWIIGDKPQKSAALEDSQDLAQKFGSHHPPYLVAALRPRIRKENVNVIRARVRESTKSLPAFTVDNRCIFKSEPEDLFLGTFNTCPLPLDAKKVRGGISSGHFDKKASLMTSDINLKRPGIGSPPTGGKRVRQRFGERSECPLCGLEARHAR